jgi:DNA-binding phage protein
MHTAASDLHAVALWLRTRMTERNETAASLAARTGNELANVARVLNGHPESPTSTLSEVARALGLRLALAEDTVPDLLLSPVHEKADVESIADIALKQVRFAMSKGEHHFEAQRPTVHVLPNTTPYVPASPPRSADVILYLDLDGVVQHEAVLYHPKLGIYMSPTLAPGRVLFEWVHHLEECLEAYPNVALVLSSTWCIRPGYADTLKRLPPSIRTRFLGGTYHRKIHGVDPWNLQAFRETPRGLQIWADVQRRRPRAWLALDDDVEDWPTFALENLVACDGTTGLSCSEVREELTGKLAQCQESLQKRR